MSWQAYIDTSLIASGHVDKGAIYNLEGTSCWATSDNFTISPEEMAEIVKCLKGDTDNAFASGLHLGGEKYVLTKVDSDLNMLALRKGLDGLVIQSTIQAIVIAHYVEGMVAGNTATTVSTLVEYLKGQQY